MTDSTTRTETAAVSYAAVVKTAARFAELAANPNAASAVGPWPDFTGIDWSQHAAALRSLAALVEEAERVWQMPTTASWTVTYVSREQAITDLLRSLAAGFTASQPTPTEPESR